MPAPHACHGSARAQLQITAVMAAGAGGCVSFAVAIGGETFTGGIVGHHIAAKDRDIADRGQNLAIGQFDRQRHIKIAAALKGMTDRRPGGRGAIAKMPGICRPGQGGGAKGLGHQTGIKQPGGTVIGMIGHAIKRTAISRRCRKAHI